MVALATSLGAGGVRVRLVDVAAGGKVVEEWVAAAEGFKAVGGTPVGVQRAWVGTYQRAKGAGVGYRVLAAFSDYSLALLQQGQVVWAKPEGLATTRQAYFSDLPAPTKAAEAAYAAEQPGWQEKLAMELTGLKAHFGFATPEEESELRARQQAADDKNRPYRDPNGFRRLLLLLTGSGSVYALHNGDGHVLWRWDPPSGWFPSVAVAWRTPHDLTHAPEMLLLPALAGSGGAAEAGASAAAQFAVVLDVHSGQQVATPQLPAGAVRALLLPHTYRDGPMDQAVLALVTPAASGTAGTSPMDGARVSLLPDSEQAASLAASGPALHWWEYDDVSGSLAGYGISKASMSAQLLWRAPLAPPGSCVSLLAAGSPDPSHAVHSHTKVLGDRSLRFKYLSPNLVAAVTGTAAATTPGSKEGSSKASAGASITLTLLDGVTGRVLFSQAHQDARGPVHLVAEENWVAYHYFSSAHGRYQTTIVELYDDTAKDITIGDVIAKGGASASEAQSSYQQRTLEALSQSYFTFQLPSLAALGVTTSAKGMAQKQLLLGTTSGQVYSIDRRMLDPRRPVRPNGKPTPEDQAEGLVPYSETLPYRPTGYLTLNKQVANLRGIATAPAVLESAALVLVYGLDLFYTRTSPSGTFDLLGPDFPAALLVTVTTAMLVATLVLRKLAAGRALKAKWQ